MFFFPIIFPNGILLMYRKVFFFTCYFLVNVLIFFLYFPDIASSGEKDEGNMPIRSIPQN